ncbi:MAG: helix-turn-helix domain-containing protein [Eubacteriales bacterium]
MTLSEKLYNLRRKQGLSQEGLAEKLDCSRQVISKWETGTTTPDAEKLQKYSELFGVSIDYLVKDDIDEPSSIHPTEKNSENKRFLGILGLVVSLIGCVSLIVFGAIMVFNSKTADKIAQSSVIVMDGTFIAMLISVLFVVFGAIILIKTMKHK